MGEGGEGEWDTIKEYAYFNLIKFLLGSFFTILGLHLSIYGKLQTYKLWNKYLEKDNNDSNDNNNNNNNNIVTGDIISSNANTNYFSSSSNFYEVTILYEVTSHIYSNNPRYKFRYPHSFETKRYIRTFQLPLPTRGGNTTTIISSRSNNNNNDDDDNDEFVLLNRGDAVDILLLPDMPRSGCILSVIEQAIVGTSSCCCMFFSIALFGIPGICLLGIFIGLCIEEILSADDQQEQTKMILICIVVLVISYVIAKIISVSRYQKVKRKLFECAVPIKDQHQHQLQTRISTRRTISSSSSSLSSAYSNDNDSGMELCSNRNRKREPLL